MSLAIKSHDHAEGFSQKMTSAEYHAHPAISNTGLKNFLSADSPAHYIHEKKNPKEPSASLKFGIAAHDAVLQPDIFSANNLVMPVFTGFTKDGKPSTQSADVKEKREKWLIENAGKNIISEKDLSSIQEIVKAVKAHPSASKLLNPGHAELSFFWTDFETGVECRCRPDFLRDGHILVDLKTTESANLNNFSQTIAKYKYHMQAAFYLDGVSQVTGQNYNHFEIIAVESAAPYEVAVYSLDDATIEKGRELYRRALAQYAQCLKTNQWPAYSSEIQPINLPAWAWSE